MMGKVDHRFLKNVNVITGELQYDLVVVEWKPGGQKQNVVKLRDVPCRQLF